MDRLKEIRKPYEGYGTYFDKDVIEIQQASYNLGRDEVIEEILEWAKTYLNISNISFNSVRHDTEKAGGDKVRKLVKDKLISLKENKK